MARDQTTAAAVRAAEESTAPSPSGDTVDVVLASSTNGMAGYFFLVPWMIILLGATLHVQFDRKPNRRTPRRVIELYLVWLMAFGGAWSIFGALGHLGPNSTDVAADIGYAPSMFQWEVGWGDVVIGVLGLGCVRMRGQWLTAAVVALVFGYGGDAIGHIMQYVEHDNTEPDNVWAIPSDIAQPLLAAVLLVVYRRLGARRDTAPAVA